VQALALRTAASVALFLVNTLYWLGFQTLCELTAFLLELVLPLAARIAIIVICAVSALIVVVLSAVYTKRAIDKRLANVHVEEEVQVEEQHYLLGASSSREIDDEEARLADSSTQRVMISVETPRLIVRRSSSSGDANKMQALQGQLHQPLQQPLRTLASSPPANWGTRFAQRLGFNSGSSKKVKAAEDAEDAAGGNHSAHPGSSTPPTAAVSSSNGSKTTCVNRNGH